LLQNEYRPRRIVFESEASDETEVEQSELATLAEIGKRLGRKMLAEVAKPDTILAWYRNLAANKLDGSERRQYPGRPTVPAELQTRKRGHPVACRPRLGGLLKSRQEAAESSENSRFMATTRALVTASALEVTRLLSPQAFRLAASTTLKKFVGTWERSSSQTPTVILVSRTSVF
jgi:hypothetical protein